MRMPDLEMFRPRARGDLVRPFTSCQITASITFVKRRGSRLLSTIPRQ